MNLLAHRGLWRLPQEKNCLEVLKASFELGIGVETDIRDCDGAIVISHDLPRSANVLTLDVVLEAYVSVDFRPTIALNIKADGLQSSLFDLLRRYGVENYFVFDMSVPDTLGYQRLNMPFAARISEYEPSNELATGAPYIWLDAFHGDWFDVSSIKQWIDKGKQVVVVSPELHRRPHLPLWQKLRALKDKSKVYLCTDLIFEAKEFFDANKN